MPVVVAARLEELARKEGSGSLAQEEAAEKVKLQGLPADAVLGRSGVQEAGQGPRRQRAEEGKAP